MILAARHAVYETAKAAHPERWNGRATRNWDDIPATHLNPHKVIATTETHVEASDAG